MEPEDSIVGDLQPPSCEQLAGGIQAFETNERRSEIAIAYGSWWVYSDFGALEYLPFCWKMKRAVKHIAESGCVAEGTPKRSALKLVDEYNTRDSRSTTSPPEHAVDGARRRSRSPSLNPGGFLSRRCS